MAIAHCFGCAADLKFDGTAKTRALILVHCITLELLFCCYSLKTAVVLYIRPNW